MFEEYETCGSACPATCDETPRMCTAQCVSGCYCIAGYVRNTADGTCCKPEQCPGATPNPDPERVCPLHEVYNDCGSSCPDTCTNYNDTERVCTDQCVHGCFCEVDYVRNLADGTCCKREECPGATPNPDPERVCPLHEVYNDCGSSCPDTCTNYNDTERVCTDQCVQGCFCEVDYVRNLADGTCCKREECPGATPNPDPERVCPLHEVYNDCGSSCPNTCANYKDTERVCTMQCVQGCFCEGDYVRNSAGTCCKREECPAPVTPTPKSCPLNQVYNSCGTACPLTCKNRLNPPKACTRQCVIGCECAKGYYKKDDGSCCLPEQC